MAYSLSLPPFQQLVRVSEDLDSIYLSIDRCKGSFEEIINKKNAAYEVFCKIFEAQEVLVDPKWQVYMDAKFLRLNKKIISLTSVKPTNTHKQLTGKVSRETEDGDTVAQTWVPDAEFMDRVTSKIDILYFSHNISPEQTSGYEQLLGIYCRMDLILWSVGDCAKELLADKRKEASLWWKKYFETTYRDTAVPSCRHFAHISNQYTYLLSVIASLERRFEHK